MEIAGGEVGDRGWDGWMASLTQWTWVWASSRKEWRTGKPSMLQSVRSQKVRHDWAAEQQQLLWTGDVALHKIWSLSKELWRATATWDHFQPQSLFYEWLANEFSFVEYTRQTGSKGLKMFQFSSVAQSSPILCNPINRSTPSLPVHHQLPEFIQTHVHQVGDPIQPSHPLSSPSPPAPNPSQHQSLFQWINSSHEVAKVLEVQL